MKIPFITYRHEGTLMVPGINWSWDRHAIVFSLKIGPLVIFYRRRRKHGAFGHKSPRNCFTYDWMKGF